MLKFFQVIGEMPKKTKLWSSLLVIIALVGLVMAISDTTVWAAPIQPDPQPDPPQIQPQPPTGGGVIGTIPLPTHLAESYGDVTTEGGGLVGLMSNLIKMIIMIGGLWAFINLIIAGFYYVMYGGDNPEGIVKAHQKIYMSLIGLIVMVGSFVLAGIIGWVAYGDPSVILNPVVYGPN